MRVIVAILLVVLAFVLVRDRLFRDGFSSGSGASYGFSFPLPFDRGES